MSKKHLFVKRVGLVGLTNVITLLIGIILIPLFTKGRPIEYYGIWVQINVSLALIPALTCLGLPYTLIRYIPGETDNQKIKDTVYSILLVIISLNIFISPLIAYILIRYVIGNQMELLSVFSALLIIQCIYSVEIAYLRALQRIKIYSLIIILQNLFTAAGVGLAIYYGYGVFGALKTLLVINISISALMIYLIIKDLGIGFPKFTYIKEHLNFGLPTILGNFSDWIISSSDRYMIGYFLGIVYVGYYNPAYSLASLVNIFMWPLIFMLPPKLSELYEENQIAEIKIYLEYSLKYYLLLAIPSLFGLSALSRPILTILSTTEIAERANLIVPVVSTGLILYGVYAILSQVFVIKKKTAIIARIWLIAAILNFLFNIIAIPLLGINGAALTTLLAYCVALTLTARYAMKLLKIPLRKRDIIKIIVSSIIMYIPVSLMDKKAITGLFYAIIAGIAVYFILIILTGVFDKKEVEFIKKII